MRRATPHSIEVRPDGSVYSADFDDVFFSTVDGLEESRHVFLEGNGLRERFAHAKGSFTIGELGFGTGLNFLATWKVFRHVAPHDAQLDFISIEKHPLNDSSLRDALRHWSELHELAEYLLAQYRDLSPGWRRLAFDDGRIRLTLCIGDVADVLPELDFEADAWFLDGFAPTRNHAMWSADVLSHVCRLTKLGGTVATYTAAGDVRRRFADAGFDVECVPGFGTKRHMTRGTRSRTSSANISTDPWDRWPTRAAQSRDVIVIGAGLAGCTCARALAERGWSITIVDQDEIASGASAVPLAIFEPHGGNPNDPIAAYRNTAFAHAAHALHALADHVSVTKCGVRKAADDGSAEELPGGTVEPRALCDAMLDHPNITVRSHFAASQLEQAAESWYILDQHGDTLTAPIVIVASAISAPSFEQLSWLPLTPVAGQVTGIPATDASRSIDRVYIFARGYLTPADAHGMHTLGATFDRNNANATPTPDADRANITNLHAAAPHLAAALELTDLDLDTTSFESWAGVRATLPDRLPAVGPVSDRAAFFRDFEDLQHGKPRSDDAAPDATWLPGLYCSLGHGSHGVISSLLAAEIIASQIAGTPLPIPLSMLRTINPARFIIRDLKRGIAHHTSTLT